MRVPSFKPTLSSAAVLTLCGGLAATALLFGAVARLELERVALAFEQRANLRVLALREHLSEAVDLIGMANHLFATVQPVTREQFRAFTAPLLQRHAYIAGFNYHRLVDASERPALEAELRRRVPGAALHEVQDGVRRAAPRRQRYYVVDYVEPLAGNEAAFGLDVSDNPHVAKALAAAVRTNRPAATGLMSLAQDRQPRHAVEVLVPVYRSGAPLATPAQRQAALVGDTAALIRPHELVKRIVETGGLLSDSSLRVLVHAGAAGDPDALVYESMPAPPAGTADRAGAWLARLLRVRYLDHLEANADMAGHPWHIAITAVPRPFLDNHLGSLSVLVGGTLLSFLLTGLVQLSVRRARRVQALVAERTADLKQSNERLLDDVVARKRTEQALHESEQRFRQLVSMSSDWYWEQDHGLRFVHVSSDIADKAGIPAERFLGKTAAEVIDGLAGSEWGEAHLARLAAHQPFTNVEFALEDADGSRHWFSINGAPMFDQNGAFAGYRGTGADITSRKLTEQRIHHVAQHDVLTGLPNRSLLQDRLSQAVAYAERTGKPIWVMLVDLDRFKFVNDSMGHKAGDVLLMTVAARLHSALRDTDTVARLSGDEFVVILSGHDQHKLSPDIVQRLMDKVAEPVMLGTKDFNVTCSIGVAVYPTDGTPAESLIEHADIAMYRAKKLGRNNFQFYTPAMNEEAQERVRIESALRKALERDEFVLHYQPQVDLATGAVVGMEALLRWQHPELGMVPPARFIGVAEDTGLIVPIGAWVMRTAAAQNKAWQDAGLGQLRVAVNLSARQFAADDLIASIRAVLEETGLEPRYLEIELTESLFMSDIAQAVEILHQMKALGIKLSIDDFGTGYSSLSYLSRFPIDVLKIDRSFVNDIARDASDAAIVASIIALAHNLQLNVIAEGVESPEQLHYLRRHGCDEMQGYYFSRPLAAADFAQLLRQRRSLAVAPPELDPEPV